MKVFYTYKAQDDLERLPPNTQRRIADKMRFYASHHDPLRFAKRLTNTEEGEFRFRIGDYRLFFDVKKGILYVLRIIHRSQAY